MFKEYDNDIMTIYEYPPTSNDLTTINQLLQVYKTVIDNKKAIYISTPMTSGLLYMNEFEKLTKSEKKLGLTVEKRNHLFNKNCHRARSVVTITRLNFPSSVVIDPTHIEVKGWEQNDYLTFWRQLISESVHVIQFVNDWNYSNGCAYEFLVGVSTNKVMIDEKYNTIYPENGRELIKKAYGEHLKKGYDNKFLSSIIKSLESEEDILKYDSL